MQNMGLVDKVKGFLIHPTKTFRKVKKETLQEGIRYFIILLFIYSILSAVMWGTVLTSMFQGFQNIPIFENMFTSQIGISIVALFIIFLLTGLIGIFISAAIIHIGVLLFGGRNGYSETVKALIYGTTPSYVFGWIPFIGPIFGIWAFILEIFGIKELQDLSTGRAIAAILIPIIIFGILLTMLISAVVDVYVSNMF